MLVWIIIWNNNKKKTVENTIASEYKTGEKDISEVDYQRSID